jgi:hypothetical protein
MSKTDFQIELEMTEKGSKSVEESGSGEVL